MKIASGNDKLEAADFAAVVTLNDLKKKQIATAS